MRGECDVDTTSMSDPVLIREDPPFLATAFVLPLRQALAGMDNGPEMGSLLALIGREKAAKRLAGQTA